MYGGSYDFSSLLDGFHYLDFGILFTLLVSPALRFRVSWCLFTALLDLVGALWSGVESVGYITSSLPSILSSSFQRVHSCLLFFSVTRARFVLRAFFFCVRNALRVLGMRLGEGGGCGRGDWRLEGDRLCCPVPGTYVSCWGWMKSVGGSNIRIALSPVFIYQRGHHAVFYFSVGPLLAARSLGQALDEPLDGFDWLWEIM